MKNTYLEILLQKHRNKGAVIDSSLLLLYFIGNYKIELICRFSKTKQFSLEEFNFLDRIVNHFKFIATTPNILTEVNNLSNDLHQEEKPEFRETFKGKINIFKEDFFKSDILCKRKFFIKVGLTDVSIISLANKGFIVFTTDLQLTNFLEHLKLDVINWNNLKSFIWEYG